MCEIGGVWLLGLLSGFHASFPILGTVFLSSPFQERMQRFLLEIYFSLGKTHIGTVSAGTRLRQVLLHLLYVDAHRVV